MNCPKPTPMIINNTEEKEEKKEKAENLTGLDLLYLHLSSSKILESKINLLKLYIIENKYDTESIKMDLNNDDDDEYDNKESNFFINFNNEKFIKLLIKFVNS